MKEGDIILGAIPQRDGLIKNRPLLLLRSFPPFGDFLACGISTQLHQFVPDFDKMIVRPDEDFPASGLSTDSIVRLGFLATIPKARVLGRIGSISPNRQMRQIARLAQYLIEGQPICT